MRVVVSLVLCATLAACSSSSDGGGGVRPTVSSHFGIATVDGKQKLYAAATIREVGCGNGRIAVYDPEAAPGSDATLGFVDLGLPDVEVSSVSAEGEEVVAVGLSPYIWFIDARTDTVKKRLALPASFGVISISDQLGSSLGVIVDAKRRRAFASVWNGILELDLDQMEIARSFPTAPPENFGYDPSRGIIAAPFYGCNNGGSSDGPPCTSFVTGQGELITEGLAVIDVTSGQPYTFRNDAAPDPTRPLGAGPDDASFDLGLGLMLVASEDAGVVNLIDLAGLQLDDANRTCSARVTVLPMPDTSFSPMVVDTGTHTAIIAQEFTNRYVLLDLVAARHGQSAGVALTLPDLPDGLPWQTYFDPHGLITGTYRGRPTAFVANWDKSYIARIDLQDALRLARPAPPFATPPPSPYSMIATPGAPTGCVVSAPPSTL